MNRELEEAIAQAKGGDAARGIGLGISGATTSAVQVGGRLRVHTHASEDMAARAAARKGNSCLPVVLGFVFAAAVVVQSVFRG